MTTAEHIARVNAITARPRLPDPRYWLLHLKCADGSATADELAELDLMQAMKIEEYENTRDGGTANNLPPSDQ